MSAPSSTRIAAPPRASPQPRKSDAKPSSSNPASAAFSAIPPSLLASRNDATHPRIRMVDPKTGEEKFFLLPRLRDEEDDEEAEEEAAEAKQMTSQERRAAAAAAMEEDEDQASAPTKGFKCCLPSTTVTGAKCGKFVRTTNALGSHLRMTHGLAKAISTAGDPSELYIECIQ